MQQNMYSVQKKNLFEKHNWETTYTADEMIVSVCTHQEYPQHNV
jgi:hypothetical protein